MYGIVVYAPVHVCVSCNRILALQKSASWQEMESGVMVNAQKIQLEKASHLTDNNIVCYDFHYSSDCCVRSIKIESTATQMNSKS